MNRILNYENKKMYKGFVDFKKAFDVVYRNGIWFKLISYGESSKIVNMLKVMYENVKVCVKVNGCLSDYFGTNKADIGILIETIENALNVT
jgi:hypothetical protein